MESKKVIVAGFTTSALVIGLIGGYLIWGGNKCGDKTKESKQASTTIAEEALLARVATLEATSKELLEAKKACDPCKLAVVATPQPEKLAAVPTVAPTVAPAPQEEKALAPRPKKKVAAPQPEVEEAQVPPTVQNNEEPNKLVIVRNATKDSKVVVSETYTNGTFKTGQGEVIPGSQHGIGCFPGLPHLDLTVTVVDKNGRIRYTSKMQTFAFAVDASGQKRKEKYVWLVDEKEQSGRIQKEL